MKKAILFMALVPMALASCLSDNGNYDYTELEAVEISGLADNMRCVLLEQQNLDPTVTTAIPQDRLQYVWRIAADTLCKTKKLDYTFKEVPVNNDPLMFEVIDTKTRVRYSKAINLSVVSPFTSGYAVLTDAGKLTFQSFEAGERLYQDIYQEVNGDALLGTPKDVKFMRFQDGGTGQWLSRLSITMQGGKSVEVDGLSLQHAKTYEDEFRSGKAPQIGYVSSQYYGADKAYSIITADGQVYVKLVGSMGLPDDGYYEYPLLGSADGGYQLAPMMTRVTSNDADYVGFDEKNHCFVMWMGTSLSGTVDPMSMGSAYDNIPGKLLWIGTPLYNSTCYAIVKDEGKYTLYVMSYGYSYTTWTYEATMEASAVLPDGVVNDNCCFAANIMMSGYDVTTNYLFIGDGPKLKAINLMNLSNINDAIVDVATFDGDITDMHFDRDVNVLPNPEFSIAVSRSNGSSVYQIDPTIVNHGAILKRYDGIQGRIVSFCRKY